MIVPKCSFSIISFVILVQYKTIAIIDANTLPMFMHMLSICTVKHLVLVKRLHVIFVE